MTVEIKSNENSVYLAKVDSEGIVSVTAKKIANGLIEITYIGKGVIRVVKSGSLLAVRMISGLTGIEYAKVNEALQGVA